LEIDEPFTDERVREFNQIKRNDATMHGQWSASATTGMDDKKHVSFRIDFLQAGSLQLYDTLVYKQIKNI